MKLNTIKLNQKTIKTKDSSKDILNSNFSR